MNGLDISQKPIKLILPIGDIQDHVRSMVGEYIPDGMQYRYIGKALDIYSTIVITGDTDRDHIHLEQQMLVWQYDDMEKAVAHCLYQYVQQTIFENGLPSSIIHKASYNTHYSSPTTVVVDLELMNFTR